MKDDQFLLECAVADTDIRRLVFGDRMFDL